MRYQTDLSIEIKLKGTDARMFLEMLINRETNDHISAGKLTGNDTVSTSSRIF